MQPPHLDRSPYRPVVDIISRKDALAQGLTHYFTGKPCKRGHVNERFAGNGHCVACHKGWNAAHPELARARRERIAADPSLLAAERERGRRYFKENQAVVTQRQVERKRAQRQQDPSFRLRHALRNRIWNALSKQSVWKADGTAALIGCSRETLLKHLEAQFLPGMTWENYGQWHVDHVRPCASFDLADLEQQRACFHYSNLQPLWRQDNLSKGAALPAPAYA